MAYAGALWLAVNEELYRGVLNKPSFKSTSKSPGPPSCKTPNSQHSSCLKTMDENFLFQCFHLTRPCLSFIVDFIRTRMKKDVFRPSNDAASDEAMTLAALYFFAHGFLPRKITDMLGLEQSQISHAVNSVSAVLEDMCPDFVTFPAGYQDRMGVAEGFRTLSGIPNVVGVLCHLHAGVHPHAAEQMAFLNAHGYNSVMMQIVSDADGNLLSVEQCWPGGSEEHAIWEKSSIFQEFNSLRHGQTWILGGQALGKAKHILTPVDVSQIKSNAALRFNTAHTQVLHSTRNVLGSLKSRFQCLHNLGAVKSNDLKSVARIITACCVLHNIAKKFSVPLPTQLVLEPEPQVRRLRHQVEGNRIEETVEDMIETCFSRPEDQ